MNLDSAYDKLFDLFDWFGPAARLGRQLRRQENRRLRHRRKQNRRRVDAQNLGFGKFFN